MNQSQIDEQLAELKNSGFFRDEEFKMIQSKCDYFINEINNELGDNDGEPLDEDGIQFITKLLELKWKLSNAVYEDEP